MLIHSHAELKRGVDVNQIMASYVFLAILLASGTAQGMAWWELLGLATDQ